MGKIAWEQRSYDITHIFRLWIFELHILNNSCEQQNSTTGWPRPFLCERNAYISFNFEVTKNPWIWEGHKNFLIIFENFTWFQKINRDGVTCTFTLGKTVFIYEFGILYGGMIFYERHFT